MTAVRLYPHFNCKDCIEAGKQKERGCEEEASFAYWTDIDGVPRTRCPRRPIFENPHWFNQIISAYNFYKNGILPHAGGMVDQAALFPFLMSTVDNIINLCDKVEMDKKQSAGSGEGQSVLRRRRDSE